MTTKQEWLIAAECAEKWPKGHGFDYFSDAPNLGGTNVMADVAHRLSTDPSSAEKG